MKADLDDGFARISITLLYALPLFRLSGCEEAVIKLVMASAWGHATRSPGYTCDLSPVEMIDYLDGVFSRPRIYHAIQKLREVTILDSDPDSLTINPAFVKALSPELVERLRVMLDRHNSRKRYSRPVLKPFRSEGEITSLENKTGSLENKTRLYKDARAGRERERLKSSSYLTGNNLENTVPNSQTADDEFKAQSQRLRQELVRLAAQRARKAESELAASIDGITGKTPQDLALGMARLIDRMRADERWGPINLRGLLVTASDPSNGNWGNATVESVLSSLRPVAPAPPPVDQDALYAAARAAEREQRMRQT